MATRYYIDGYNVLHKSAALRPLAQEDYESAREALVDRVGIFCMATGNRVTVVFDGRGQHKPERQVPLRGVAGLDILFSPKNSSADAVIERLVYKASNRMSLVVVSNDHALRDLCCGMGALTMDADNFLATVREAKSEITDSVQNTHRQKAADHLDERLDESQLDALKALRDKLEK